MTDYRAQLFVCLTAKCELEVGERGDVVPLVCDLTFINTGHEFESRNGVLGRITIEVWKLDDLRLHGDIGVSLDLPGQIRSIIIALNGWLNVLDVSFVETGASSDWFAV
jgi:hypothetical protein